MLRRPRLALFLAVPLLGVAACRAGPPIVILVSVDGFAERFRDFGVTPALESLASEGVWAEALVPVFPTKTFPNHYSIVTGLHPENHGIVSNNMYDPEFDATFSLGDREAVTDPRWWEGEPLWVTAAKQGLVTAAFFWPGTEVEIQGHQPTYWRPYDGSIPNRERVDQVLAWLDLPEERRPRFVTLYFSSVDGAVHRHGIDAAESLAAMAHVDSMIARLLGGIAERGMGDRVHVIVVSDHGMAATSPDSVIFLDDYVDLEAVRVSDWSPLTALWPLGGEVDSLAGRLARGHDRWTVYRTEDIPDAWHYRAHRRIAPVLALTDEGWSVTTRDFFARNPDALRGATHGWDHRLPSMQALFVARGPAFRRGAVVPPFQNVHLHALMAHVLGLDPVPPTDGTLDSVRTVLR